MGGLRTVLGSYDGAIVGYEIDRSMPRPFLAETAHASYVSAISSCSSFTATAASDCIQLFDIEKGVSLGELALNSGVTRCLAFFGLDGNDSEYLLRVSSEGDAQIWRSKDWTSIAEKCILHKNESGVTVLSAALDPCNPVSLLVLLSTGEVALYDVHTGKRIKTLMTKATTAFKVTWSTEGRFAVILADKTCHLMDLRQGLGTEVPIENVRDHFSCVVAGRDILIVGTATGKMLLYRIFTAGSRIHTEVWLQLEHPRTLHQEPNRVKAMCLVEPPRSLLRLSGLLIAANAQGDVSYWRLSAREKGVGLKSVIPTTMRITALATNATPLKGIFAEVQQRTDKPRFRLFRKRHRFRLLALAHASLRQRRALKTITAGIP